MKKNGILRVEMYITKNINNEKNIKQLYVYILIVLKQVYSFVTTLKVSSFDIIKKKMFASKHFVVIS